MRAIYPSQRFLKTRLIKKNSFFCFTHIPISLFLPSVSYFSSFKVISRTTNLLEKELLSKLNAQKVNLNTFFDVL